METCDGLDVCLTIGHLGADDSPREAVDSSDSNFADACDASGENEDKRDAPYLFPQSQRRYTTRRSGENVKTSRLRSRGANERPSHAT